MISGWTSQARLKAGFTVLELFRFFVDNSVNDPVSVPVLQSCLCLKSPVPRAKSYKFMHIKTKVLLCTEVKSDFNNYKKKYTDMELRL